VAAAFALVLTLGLLASTRRALLLPLYLLYAAATIALRRPGEPATITAGSLVFFPLVHVGYAAGLIVGAVRTPRALRGASEGERSHNARRRAQELAPSPDSVR
jgi:hypothetical protein